MATVILVRHGRTTANASGRLAGRTDTLDPVGGEVVDNGLGYRGHAAPLFDDGFFEDDDETHPEEVLGVWAERIAG